MCTITIQIIGKSFCVLRSLALQVFAITYATFLRYNLIARYTSSSRTHSSIGADRSCSRRTCCGRGWYITVSRYREGYQIFHFNQILRAKGRMTQCVNKVLGEVNLPLNITFFYEQPHGNFPNLIYFST